METSSTIYHSAKKYGVNLEEKKRLLILGDPVFCSNYAINIIKGPWIEAHHIIKRHPYAAYNYSKDVLKDRFIDAEEYILKNQIPYIYYYARDIIKGRWKEAEPIILQHEEFCYLYARDIIKGQWKEAEETISKNLKYSFLYSTNVLKAPFIKCSILFEPLENNRWSNYLNSIKKKYRKFLIKNGFTEWII